MQTAENKMEMTGCEELQLRNSPALFEFYRSLIGLNAVLVQYVQSGRTLEEVEAYSADIKLEARAEEAANACQELTRQFGGGCPPGSTWDPATGTCGG